MIESTPITSSVVSDDIKPPKLTYETKGDERFLAIVLKKVENMERELHDLKVKKILDETQLPPDLLAQNGLIPILPRKVKRGRGYRPILRSEIEEAKKKSIFGVQQAKFLGVHVSTFRRYAKLHGLWDPQPKAKGKKHPANPDGGKYPLNRVLTGEFNGNPGVTDWIVRKKLFRSNRFQMKCAICGYDKKRLGGEFPILLIDHMDGDRNNFKEDNLRFLCWNCTAECGRGYLRGRFKRFDPNWSPD